MNNKFLRCLMVTAAAMVSVGVYSPMTVYADEGTMYIQACEEGAPVEAYTVRPDSDYTAEELFEKEVKLLRNLGGDEATIQEEIAQLRVKYGLTPASAPAKTEAKKAEPSYTQEQIDAAWEEVSRTEATCTDGVVATYKNSLTGKTKTENVSKALGHKYEEAVTKATCVADGKTVYTCSVCGYSTEEVIPSTGEHTYEETVKEATCKEVGSITYTCTACGDSYEETLPAHGHMAGESVVTSKAGLFVEGKTVVSCTSCGEVLEMGVIPQRFPISLGSTVIILGAFFITMILIAMTVRSRLVKKVVQS